MAGLGTMDHFGKQQPVPIGSVAKAMTAYVILKDHPLALGAKGPSIRVDETAAKHGASVDEDTTKPPEAYAKVAQRAPARAGDDWLPG